MCLAILWTKSWWYRMTGWRMNTNNIRNMNTNTLCVEHLKYEYTQFLLFIFTNIIRSSTPPLATITALQKAAKEHQNTYMYLELEPTTSWSFVYRFANSDIGCGSATTCLLPLSISVIGRRPTTDQWYAMLKQMPIESVLDPGLVAESKGAYLRWLWSAATMQGVPKRASPRKNSSS